MKPQEVTKLQDYLRKTLGNKALTLKTMPKKQDFAEVYIGEDFIGTITRDEDDEDLSYSFTMSILDYDLNGGQP